VLVTVIGWQLVGVAGGVRMRSQLPTARLPQLIAGTAALAAGWLLWRSFPT
jgi:hypothetical protein